MADMYSRILKILESFGNGLLLLVIAITLVVNALLPSNHTYAHQTYSWLHRHLDIPKDFCLRDCVSHNGKYYWTLGPLPSVLLIPFVFTLSHLNYQISESVLNVLLTLGVFYLAYKTALKFNFNKIDSGYLAGAFTFGSSFFQVAINSKSWNLSHSVSVFILQLAVLEFFGKRRYTIIGILLSLLLASRPTAFLCVIFFLMIQKLNKKNLKQYLINITGLLLPSLLMLSILFLYNYSRFGNVFENGYSTIAKNVYIPMIENHYSQKISHDIFDINHIPRNFSVYFLTPIVSAGIFGINVNFFLVNLPFIHTIFIKRKQKYVSEIIITIGIILISILSYYYSGWDQIGPRYVLDFFPLFYLLLLYSFRDQQLSFLYKFLVILSVYLNFAFFAFQS